jgi:methylglutaconyl-CoA hydratase
MSYSTLEIQRDGAVATLWMNRPEVFNAFDEQLIAELTQACQALDHDDSVRVVVLAGRGRHFSAGADLNWMRRAASHGEAENLADARQFARMLRTLATLSKPTVARVHGAALGGGAGLTAACQMAIASDDAVFSTSEVRFGIIPAVISPYVLQAIGPRQAIACPGLARWPIDRTGTPYGLGTGNSFLSTASGRCPSLAIRRGCDGP